MSISGESDSEINWESIISCADEVSVNYESILNCSPQDINELKSKMLNKNIVLVDSSLRLELSKIVNHRSVKSHFLKYFDYIEMREGKWWGYSLYSEIFYQVLLGAIKNQDYKGSVIFLGNSPVVFPILEVLTSFGFNDFVFMDCSSRDEGVDLKLKSYQGFIGANFSMVDSTTFIQSQKEYSLCFVIDKTYSAQVIDDMSYFHFLSSRSMVFDIVGSTNFLFKEVGALGVDIVEFDTIQDLLKRIYLAKISQYARDIGYL